MLGYVIRRLLYAVPILAGVALLTFILFYVAIPPEQMARRNLSAKNPSKAQIQQWLKDKGYDKPPAQQFAKHVSQLFLLQFGKSDTASGEDIWERIRQGAGPSFQIQLTIFTSALFASICMALVAAYFRGTYVDTWVTILCVLGISISYVVYIYFLQFSFGKVLKYFPLFGWSGGITASWKFVWLPSLVGLINGVFASARLYRTFLLDEMNQDYVRTARAKGVREQAILFGHVLKNAAIPILTSVVTALPLLFTGSLLIESYFGIPGLGSYLVDAINSSDFAVVRAMVFLATLLYIVGLILTDISYALVDPRVRFE
jgi:peptide/nickel transport system permease protein